MQIEGLIYKVTAYVIPDMAYSVLLGKKFMAEAGFVLDLGANTCRLPLGVRVHTGHQCVLPPNSYTAVVAKLICSEGKIPMNTTLCVNEAHLAHNSVLIPRTVVRRGVDDHVPILLLNYSSRQVTIPIPISHLI